MRRVFHGGAGAAVALVLASGLAACGGSSGGSGGSKGATLAPSEIASRYHAAMAPATTALASVVTDALAYQGGSLRALDAAAHTAPPVIKGAAQKLGGIAAPPTLQRDIADVATALDTVSADLVMLASATGADVEPALARLVADAGREAAADAVVTLALGAATSPTTPATAPLVTAPQSDTAATTAASTTTTLRHHTTTTRPHTVTTVARTSTTLKH